MAFGDVIGLDALPARLLKKEASPIVIGEMDLPLTEQIRHYEREIILNKLNKHRNDSNVKDVVAKELGLSRATLYRKLAELNIR